MSLQPNEGDRREPPPGRKFVMKEDLLDIGDDYWIEDESGRKAYHVDGQVAGRDKFVLEDASGREVATIKEKRLTVRDKMKIERDGDTIATVRREAGWGDRFQIDLEGGGELHAKGKIAKREIEIERDGRKVAEMSRKWFTVRDSYGVEIDGTEDEALILAAVVAIEALGGE
jgi:uncharacterized protein YxjI